jgi:predicted amidophosphoribosyltransferase
LHENKFINGLLDLFFPRQCFVCNNTMNVSHYNPQEAADIVGNHSLICETCLILFPEVLIPEKPEDCGMQTIALFSYEGAGVKLIRLLKEDGAVNLLNRVVKLIKNPHQSQLQLMPVPAHRVAFRKRGFNPAARIAKSCSELWDAPIADLLYRKGIYRQLKSMNRQQRLKMQEGIWQLNTRLISEQPEIMEKSILIVDDVITTGATTISCAKILRENGFNVIGRVCLAITPK